MATTFPDRTELFGVLRVHRGLVDLSRREPEVYQALMRHGQDRAVLVLLEELERDPKLYAEVERDPDRFLDQRGIALDPGLHLVFTAEGFDGPGSPSATAAAQPARKFSSGSRTPGACAGVGKAARTVGASSAAADHGPTRSPFHPFVVGRHPFRCWPGPPSVTDDRRDTSVGPSTPAPRPRRGRVIDDRAAGSQLRTGRPGVVRGTGGRTRCRWVPSAAPGGGHRSAREWGRGPHGGGLLVRW